KPLASATPTPTPSSTPSLIAGCTAGTLTPKTQSFAKAPANTLKPKVTYLAKMQTTCGVITIRLNPKLAPKTVNNFIFLAAHHFYDGTIFHRVQNEISADPQQNFAIVQGGDPQGTGTGGPGYQYGGEK